LDDPEFEEHEWPDVPSSSASSLRRTAKHCGFAHYPGTRGDHPGRYEIVCRSLLELLRGQCGSATGGSIFSMEKIPERAEKIEVIEQWRNRSFARGARIKSTPGGSVGGGKRGTTVMGSLPAIVAVVALRRKRGKKPFPIPIPWFQGQTRGSSLNSLN